MAKKNEKAAGSAAEVKQESPAAQETKKAYISIQTTEGRTLDSVGVYQDKGAAMVKASYGKINPEGKTAEEKRKGMQPLMHRALTPAQTAEFQRLGGVYSEKALDYAARVAFPMHVDDAAYHQKETVINDRPVNYIIVEKLKEEDLKEENKHLAGSFQMSFGTKGDKSSRFYGILNSEEMAMLRHRAEVVLDKDGKVKALGAPLTLAA